MPPPWLGTPTLEKATGGREAVIGYHTVCGTVRFFALVDKSGVCKRGMVDRGLYKNASRKIFLIFFDGRPFLPFLYLKRG